MATGRLREMVGRFSADREATKSQNLDPLESLVLEAVHEIGKFGTNGKRP
jgi:hypothetical protein